MVYTIKKSKIQAWGYEITAKNFHNIAPSVEPPSNTCKVGSATMSNIVSRRINVHEVL